jgi:CRISPR system Cascade subunit CasA
MTTRLGEDLQTASWPDAARWLIHAQAFDVAGIHSGAVGDPRVKGGKGYSIGTGWAGQLGGVYLVGDSLKDTLVLNLVAPKQIGLRTDDPVLGIRDLPVWERPPLTATPEPPWSGEDYRQPRGPVDVYTWPSRRIRLYGDQYLVTQCLNAQGDKLTPQDRFHVEPMTVWRYSEPQTKKFGRPTYMPKKHQPDQELWRGLAGVLAQASSGGSASGPVRFREPGVVTWARQLLEKGCLEQRLLHIRSVGIEYGTQDATFNEVFSDDLVLPSALLNLENEDLANQSFEAVEVANQAVSALANFAQNVALASGADSASDSPRNRARLIGFNALNQEFRGWLRNLTTDLSGVEQQSAWQTSAKRIISGVAQRFVAEASTAAFIGRSVGGQHRDVGTADRWFRAALRKALPYADWSSTERSSQQLDEEPEPTHEQRNSNE